MVNEAKLDIIAHRQKSYEIILPNASALLEHATRTVMCGFIALIVTIGPVKQKKNVQLRLFSYPYVLGAQENRLIETLLLSTHSICIG